MTYLQFHLVFMVPPLILMAVLQARSSGIPGVSRRRAWGSMVAIVVIALLYTTPWDNYLVWRGIWHYGADRVVATIGYVPVEEYLFFVLQPLLTGLWLYWLMGRPGNRDRAAKSGRDGATSRQANARIAGGIVFGVLALVGAWMLTSDSTRYMGLILAWASPVLAGQWVYAGARLWQLRRVLVWAIGVPTLYLWIADRIAIGAGIWTISAQYTTGLQLVGLPIEEATFFLLTNVLVVQGLIMFILPPGGTKGSSHGRPVRAA